MNFQWRTIISAIVLLASLSALASGIIEKGDLSSAKESVRDGQKYISAILTESGKAKIKDESVGSRLTFHLGGADTSLKLRAPIADGRIEFGPFDKDTADKILLDINGK